MRFSKNSHLEVNFYDRVATSRIIISDDLPLLRMFVVYCLILICTNSLNNAGSFFSHSIPGNRFMKTSAKNDVLYLHSIVS